ncbi:Acetyltransferase (GNAT) family protein, partial [Actinopolyspora alba]
AQFFVPPDWPSEPCELRPPFWLVGCNLATRSTPTPVFDERLGVRPWRHLSCEDLELTVRTEHAGLGVVVAPNAIAHRAIHAADVRLPRLLARGFWRGVSVARLRRRHPRALIYDSAQLCDVLGAVIAFRSQDHPENLYIQDVITAPDHRRQGISTALLQAVRDTGRRFGCQRLYLTSEPDNTAAHDTWIHMGFVNVPGDHTVNGVEIISDYKGAGKHRAVYELRLHSTAVN